MSRLSLPVTTLAPGEFVIVSLTGRAVDRISQWAGEVLAVDGVGIRLKTHWFRLDLSPSHSESERFIPWGRIDDVYVQPPAAKGGAT